jgi:hypothetical protein
LKKQRVVIAEGGGRDVEPTRARCVRKVGGGAGDEAFCRQPEGLAASAQAGYIRTRDGRRRR